MKPLSTGPIARNAEKDAAEIARLASAMAGGGSWLEAVRLFQLAYAIQPANPSPLVAAIELAYKAGDEAVGRRLVGQLYSDHRDQVRKLPPLQRFWLSNR